MTENRSSPSGSTLSNSLWNLLFRVVSSMDHSKTAWTAILRGSCLAFFREPIDDLPAENDSARASFKERFFSLPEFRVYDLFEFLLSDDHAGLKEMDRKLIRRSLNELLDQEGAPVRLLRDKFMPLPDSLGIDAVAAAGEKISLFDLPAASRHLESAVAFLSRRPDAAGREAVREALLAVACVVQSLRSGEGKIAVGTVEPVAAKCKIDPSVLAGMEATLRRCLNVSGLPGASSREGEQVPQHEAGYLVVFCSSTINYLLAERPS